MSMRDSEGVITNRLPARIGDVSAAGDIAAVVTTTNTYHARKSHARYLYLV